MTTIFQDILDCRSMTVITYMCENELDKADIPPGDRTALQSILDTNSLDERYALAHEHLGEHDKAQVLRQWMAGASERRRQSQLQSQQLFDMAN